MSFFRKLFGRESSSGSPQTPESRTVEHKGFTIRATPFKEGGQFQTCGIISKEIGGVVKEHRFIRADRFAGLDEASDTAVAKGRQIIDEQGERIFS